MVRRAPNAASSGPLRALENVGQFSNTNYLFGLAMHRPRDLGSLYDYLQATMRLVIRPEFAKYKPAMAHSHIETI